MQQSPSAKRPTNTYGGRGRAKHHQTPGCWVTRVQPGARLPRVHSLFSPDPGRRQSVSHRPARHGRPHLEHAVPTRPVRLSDRPRDPVLQRAHVRGELSQPLSVQRRRGPGSGLERQGALGVRHPDHHHHGILLRNGNVLLNCMGQVPDNIARRVKGGVEEDRFPSGQYAPRSKEEAGKMYSDYLAEVTPAGQTVWEWRTWEHLDPVADGIAEVQAPRTLWAQGNSVLELPDGDILASYRPTSTVIRISRKTGN